MLLTTMMDDELSDIRGNDSEILQSVLDAFGRHFPSFASKQATKHKNTMKTGYSAVSSAQDIDVSTQESEKEPHEK